MSGGYRLLCSVWLCTSAHGWLTQRHASVSIYFLNPLFFLRLDFYFNTNVGSHTLKGQRSNDVMLNAVANGTKRLPSSRDVDIYLVLFHVEGPRPEWYWELRGREALAFLLLLLLISTYIWHKILCGEETWLKICVCRSLLLQWTKPPMCESRAEQGEVEFRPWNIKAEDDSTIQLFNFGPQIIHIGLFLEEKQKKQSITLINK